MAHRSQALADVGVQAGLGEGDGPVVDVAGRRFHLPAALAHDEIGGLVGVVVAEEILDEVATVTEAEDEVLVPVVGVELHQVPEDGPVTDAHQRLGDGVGVFAEPGAQAAAKNDYFHDRTAPEWCLECSGATGEARAAAGQYHTAAVPEAAWFTAGGVPPGAGSGLPGCRPLRAPPGRYVESAARGMRRIHWYAACSRPIIFCVSHSRAFRMDAPAQEPATRTRALIHLPSLTGHTA